MTLGGVPVGLPHAAFLQATQEGEAALAAAVLEALGDAARVADMFAGLGTFSLALGTSGRRVTASEASRDALLALKIAANRAQKPVETDHRDLYRRPFMTKELAIFDAVVLDPPRAGAEAQVEQLMNSAVPTIAYVSCNPQSFARDAATLIEGGYKLDWIQPVGQFRWSTHVELAAKLSR
jgi:23S rRNA (uracil1939-C5)-methyltransferase